MERKPKFNSAQKLSILKEAKETGVRPMFHTDLGAAYCSLAFNHYLEKMNCVHSISHPGHPWKNSPMERWWNDFKLLWMERHPQPQSFKELKELIDEGVKYFNIKRDYASKNGLTAEKFHNQTA